MCEYKFQPPKPLSGQYMPDNKRLVYLHENKLKTITPFTQNVHIFAPYSEVGKALFLTPFIEGGQLEAGRLQAKVTGPLDGLGMLPFESYSGFITTKNSTNSNMFFWFFPATVT